MFGLGGSIKACVVTVEGKRIVGGKLVLRTPHTVYLLTDEMAYEGEIDNIKREKVIIQSLTEGDRIVLE